MEMDSINNKNTIASGTNSNNTSLSDCFYDVPIKDVWDAFGFDERYKIVSKEDELACKIGKVDDYDICLTLGRDLGYYAIKMKNNTRIPSLLISKKMSLTCLIFSLIFLLPFLLPLMIFLLGLFANAIYEASKSAYSGIISVVFLVTLLIAIIRVKNSKFASGLTGKKTGNRDFDSKYRVFTENNIPQNLFTGEKVRKFLQLGDDDWFDGIIFNKGCIIYYKSQEKPYCDVKKVVKQLKGLINAFDN